MENIVVKDKISVIVPIYNVERYLPQCVESIINQTYTNLEIILVNDGSPDNCGKICDHYAAKDSRIKVIHKENGGLVSARKAGLQLSTGEYIAYVDGDDWIEEKMYSSLYKSAKESNADIVIAGHKEELGGKVVEISLNSIPAGIYKKEDLPFKVFSKMLYTGKFSQFGIYSYLWNKLFKREVIYNFQMAVDNSISMAEDAACTYPCILNAETICITEDAHYRYRQHINSMVKTRDKNILDVEKFNILYEHLYHFFSLSPFKDSLLEQLNNFILSLLTVRTDTFLVNNESSGFTYPFKLSKKNAKVIICGAGTFGQHLQHRFSNGNDITIVAWIDELYQFYQKSELPVSAIEEIHNTEYDFILVAFINEVVAEQVEERLIAFGIPANKVIKPSVFDKGDVKQILIDLGIRVK